MYLLKSNASPPPPPPPSLCETKDGLNLAYPFVPSARYGAGNTVGT